MNTSSHQGLHCLLTQDRSSVKVIHLGYNLSIIGNENNQMERPGLVAQSVTCPATDANLTVDPGGRLIPARSHTFVEIDHEIISTVILLPSAESFMKGCCQLQAKYVHKLLVNCLVKLAQENVWLGELTVQL